MSDGTLSALITDLQRDASAIVVEGVMGLFDGAPDGRGSAADLSRRTGWPVVLVVDASVWRPRSPRWCTASRPTTPGWRSWASSSTAPAARDTELCCAAPCSLQASRSSAASPGANAWSCRTVTSAWSRPASTRIWRAFLARAAERIGREVDIDALLAAARPARVEPTKDAHGLPVLGQRIAVARDDAFAFCYPYVLDAWRRAGCELSFFSPLDDEPSREDADAVYLPGGYPELHGARLADAGQFQAALRRSAERGAVVYGECGGYMVLGERLVDGDGVSHRMTGLLPVETSFESPRLSLGYREGGACGRRRVGSAAAPRFRGHEFHFASVLAQAPAPALFRTFNAEMEPLGDAGLQVGNVMGVVRASDGSARGTNFSRWNRSRVVGQQPPLSFQQRFQQCIRSIRVELNVHPRRHVVGEVEQLPSRGNRHQHDGRSLFHRDFHNPDRVRQWLDRAAEVQSPDRDESTLDVLLQKAAAQSHQRWQTQIATRAVIIHSTELDGEFVGAGDRDLRRVPSPDIEILLRVSDALAERRRNWSVQYPDPASLVRGDLDAIQARSRLRAARADSPTPVPVAAGPDRLLRRCAAPVWRRSSRLRPRPSRS